MRSSHPLCALALAATLCPVALAEDGPAATPYRPTLSNPAALPAPGYLETEFGWQRVSGGGDGRRDGLPLLLKYAFTPDWGILLSDDPHARRIDAAGAVESGQGDASVAVKHRHALSEESALGIEAGLKVPTAKATLGSGKRDYVVNGIFSTELGQAALDLNLGITRLGAREENQGRWQYAWAAALSHPIAERWTLAGELSATARRGMRGSGQFLAAVGYEWNRRVVLDGGFALGMGSQAADWSLFAGVTVLWEKPR